MTQKSENWCDNVQDDDRVAWLAADIFSELSRHRNVNSLLNDSTIDSFSNMIQMLRYRFTHNGDVYDINTTDLHTKMQVIAMGIAMAKVFLMDNTDGGLKVFKDILDVNTKKYVYLKKIDNPVTPDTTIKNSDYDYWWEFSEESDCIVVMSNYEHIPKNGLKSFYYEFDDDDERESAIMCAEEFIKDLYENKVPLRGLLDTEFTDKSSFVQYTRGSNTSSVYNIEDSLTNLHLNTNINT